MTHARTTTGWWLTAAGMIVTAGCLPSRFGLLDSGASDAGTNDAGTSDAGPSDTGTSDGGAPDAMQGEQFVAVVDGYQEVPVVGTTAMGTGTVTLSADRTMVTYSLSQTLMSPQAEHIHTAPAGEIGGVTVPFDRVGYDTTGTVAVTPTQVSDLEAGRWYFNVHSEAQPGGEIRGQILRRNQILYVASLTPAQCVPTIIVATSPDAGAPPVNTNRASVIFDPGTMQVHYRVHATSVQPVSVQLRLAPAGTAGDQVFALASPDAIVDGTHDVTADQATALASGRWYLEVRTGDPDTCALRGQLLRPGELLWAATLAGSNEVPAVTSSASGSMQLVLSADGTMARYAGVVQGVTPVAEHIHEGPAGAIGLVKETLMTSGPDPIGSFTMMPGYRAALDGRNWYVNVHSAAHGDGEIRGQLVPVPLD